MPVIAAVELVGDGPGRAQLAPIAGYSAESIGGFVATNVASGATLKTDGRAAYPGTSAVDHDRHVVGKMAAHLVLPWTHRVFACTKWARSASLKRWALGVYHDLRATIFNPTSTSSRFASTAAKPATPPSAPCSRSAPGRNLSPTKC